MKVFWTPEAQQDRIAIWDHIFAEQPAAAITMDERFSVAAQQLVLQPLSGPIGKVPGTRELILHQSFRMVYQIDQDTVWILALVHTATLWPPLQK